MCCCAEFIVKYILIIANIIFALAGVAIIGLGVATYLQIQEIADLIPVDIRALSIGIIVAGVGVFIISYLACCGAIRESRCMLIFYAIFMAILAAAKIYIAVIIFNFLDSAITTVERWIVTAFANPTNRETFHVMESLFDCCGTTGANSYTGVLSYIPPSCCASPVNDQCSIQDSYQGCVPRVGNYFETYGEAIGAVVVTVIIIELFCVVFGLFLSCQIRRKRTA